jgi:transposase-like protein
MGTRKKKRPLSKAEGFGMIAEYFNSGMSCVKYYSSHSISACQFYRWKRLYMREHPELRPRVKHSVAGKQPLFCPVEVTSRPLSISLTFPAIEIHYPCGISLYIDAGLQDVSQIERLINR